MSTAIAITAPACRNPRIESDFAAAADDPFRVGSFAGLVCLAKEPYPLWVVMTGGGFEGLLAGARAGDQAAWTQLYRTYAPKVRGYLRARGVPEPDDLLGEVMLQVVRDIARFEGDERDFRSWTFTIAHHRMLDQVRYRVARPSLAGLDAVAEEPAGNVEDEALASLSDSAVRELLDLLSEDQKTVLLLRLFAGLSIPQIAELMGKGVGAVKALQHRGLGALRRALDGDRALSNAASAMRGER